MLNAEKGAGMDTFLYFMLPSCLLTQLAFLFFYFFLVLIFSILAGVLYCFHSLTAMKKSKNFAETGRPKLLILPQTDELK
jgi:hypothetical protein